jgi:FixJ family two-component response regulator
MPEVFTTAHGDVTLAVEAMRCGAFHVIKKPFEVDALCRWSYHSRPTSARTWTSVTTDRIASLTPLERQVLDLVVAGKLNKIIADILGISIKTVELHRANMMSKLCVRHVPELVSLILGHARP